MMTSSVRATAVILGLAALGACAQEAEDPTEEAIKSAFYGAQVEVEKQLRDPTSAQYTETAVYVQPNGGYVTCGYVNAANAFGGMTGAKPFIGNQGSAVIGEGAALPVVTATWSRACVTKAAFQP